MIAPALYRPLGALVALLVILVLLVGDRTRRGAESATTPKELMRRMEDGDGLTARVDQAIEARWQVFERQLRVDLPAETGFTRDLPQESEMHQETPLNKVGAASFDAAGKELQITLDQVQVAMATLTSEIDALSARLKKEKRARTDAIASWEDQLDKETVARQQSINELETHLGSHIRQLHENTAAVQVDPDTASRRLVTTPTPVICNIVLTSDTVLVPPKIQGPIIAPVTGYSWSETLFAGENETLYERPIYNNISRDSDDFWTYLVDELLLARVHAVMLINRGCYSTGVTSDTSGPGNMCPRLLSRFVDAVNRAGAQNVIRIGMWDDTPTYCSLAGVSRFDVADRTQWSYFWNNKIKIFYDTIPKTMWFTYQGKPVIAVYSLRDTWFKNQQGNASALITWLKQQFLARYGLEPVFILQDEWFSEDTTVKAVTHALGKHYWFTPVSDNPNTLYTYTRYNSRTWGVVVPGYRNGNTLQGCGSACREVTRRNGTTLTNALNNGRNATLILLEGWTDTVESAGYYRSGRWWYLNHYINIVRSFADPEPETLRLEAEAADAFYDTTPGNQGGAYASRDLDVGALSDGSGWFVGWVEAGEWIEFKQVQLGCGIYRFTVRAATSSEGRVLELGQGTTTLSTVTLPETGEDNYVLFSLGEMQLSKGAYDLRLTFVTAGDLKLDWLFVKRSVKLSNCTVV